jgi:3'-phosphoadenosine 5'-phosphosulfate sulfotransferase (PAPS reductase)/FAD synthetase
MPQEKEYRAVRARGRFVQDVQVARMTIRHVVSVSGGKDSAATLLIALERFSRESIVPIFCDTGNEHQAVYEYLDYLELALDIKITRLKANFDAEIASKRTFIARDRRTRREYDTVPVFEADGKTPVLKRDGRGQVVLNKKGEPVQKERKIGGGRSVRWTNKAKRRALAALHPSGNPFLDLCMWKGRFPSRKAQFCTEQLKRDIAVSFQLELIAQGYTVVSWQGVRRDESAKRRDALEFEVVGGGLYIYRPLVEWSAADVFAYCTARNLQPNPLYRQGMTRVGCMYCINARKEEIREVAVRFPEHPARLAKWEEIVSQCSKRGFSTFFHKVDDLSGSPSSIYSRCKMETVIEWSRTTRGGKQFSLLEQLDVPTACSSAYGLCE